MYYCIPMLSAFDAWKEECDNNSNNSGNSNRQSYGRNNNNRRGGGGGNQEASYAYCQTNFLSLHALKVYHTTSHVPLSLNLLESVPSYHIIIASY